MKTKTIMLYFVIIVFLMVAWENLSNNYPSIKLLLSSPSDVYYYTIQKLNFIMEATLITFYESIIGLIIAVVFSFILMIICLYYPRILDFILPGIVISQIIPLITLAPLFIILLGAGINSKVAMSALMCFFPVFINFASGTRLISKDILELMDVYNASLTFKIFRVYIPLSLPSIFAGLKISSTLAVIGSIVAEFNGADMGLGKNLFLAAKRLEPDLMMSSLFFSCILGGIMFSAIYFVESKIGKWYLKK